jgi:hypothetical protein
MLKLADMDVYELVDALGMERTALVSAAKEEGRRPTDAERVMICVLRAKSFPLVAFIRDACRRLTVGLLSAKDLSF